MNYPVNSSKLLIIRTESIKHDMNIHSNIVLEINYISKYIRTHRIIIKNGLTI